MPLITFEGLDGSGKSTQIGLLAEWLRAGGHRVETVREPGGTPLSERVRSILLDPASRITPFAEMLLFSAARAQLVAERIRPLLGEDVVVLCDRFYDSTTAYQGGGRELADLEWLTGFHLKVTSGLIPHRTFLLEISPDQARARRRERAEEDRMESSGRAFYDRVGEAYARLAATEAQRFRVLDGTAPALVLASQIRDEVAALLARSEQAPQAPVTRTTS